MDGGAPNQIFDLEAKTMKGKLINVLLGVSLVVVTVASVVSAREVVTEQDREWAQKAAMQEKTLQAQPVPNSVAILYFNNKTELADLNPIQKGLAIMLITDLAKVEGLQIVERARLEALVSELNLAQKGLTDPAGNARIGRFLRAEHVVGGDLLKGSISDFKVKSSLLDVPKEEVFGNPQTEGKLLSELFKMEKELLFDIIKELQIKLTPEQEAELQKPLATNLDALLAWFAALDYSDRGDYTKAEESAEQACAQDPSLCKRMDEIGEEIEVAAAEAEKGRPRDSRETYASMIQPATEILPPDNTVDPTDRHSECVEMDYVPVTMTCGIGACRSTDSTTCVGGKVIFSCVPGIPVAEMCGDGIDNNCNGAVDEGCSTPPVVSIDSINTAHSNTFNDPALATRVENGEFVPGDMADAENDWGFVWTAAYTSGLQTIGADTEEEPASFLHPSFLAQINADPYLAYAVQIEEDRLNRQILEMHAQAAQGDLLATINDALTAGDIRSRDDLLMQRADAQAGRVLKDKDGNWVRTQQYILRPDNQTVQMLNVSLRGNGVHAGLSTIDWTTKFSNTINQPLRNLPWSDYLNTSAEEGGRYVEFINGIKLDSMYVRFTNPTSQYLQESRTFGAGSDVAVFPGTILHIQPIETEQLTSSQWQGTLVYGNDYFIRFPDGNDDDINPRGFEYITGGDVLSVWAFVSFHVLGDANTDTNIGESPINFVTQEVDDIWDALRVNESEGAPNIGDNNLEIVIDGGVFSDTPIDVVYIPLSRMLWKQSPE
jgi:TolB-like protein